MRGEALKRAKSRGGLIRSGVWITLEAAQWNTLQSITDEIIGFGGLVVNIDMMDAKVKTRTGEWVNRTIYIINAVLPDGNGIVK